MTNKNNPMTLTLSDKFRIEIWNPPDDEYIALRALTGDAGINYQVPIKPDEIATVIGGLQLAADYYRIMANSAPLPPVVAGHEAILEHPDLIDLAPASEREMLLYTKAYLEAMEAIICTAKLFNLDMVEGVYASTLVTLARRVYGEEKE